MHHLQVLLVLVYLNCRFWFILPCVLLKQFYQYFPQHSPQMYFPDNPVLLSLAPVESPMLEITNLSDLPSTTLFFFPPFLSPPVLTDEATRNQPTGTANLSPVKQALIRAETHTQGSLLPLPYPSIWIGY